MLLGYKSEISSAERSHLITMTAVIGVIYKGWDGRLIAEVSAIHYCHLIIAPQGS